MGAKAPSGAGCCSWWALSGQVREEGVPWGAVTPPHPCSTSLRPAQHTCAHSRTHVRTRTHTQSAACTVNVCCLVSEPKWKVAIFVCIGKCGPSSNSAMLNSFIFWGCYSHSSLYMQGRSPLETRPVRFEWPRAELPAAPSGL